MGSRGDTGRPITRLCRLPLLGATETLNPRLAAAWAARECGGDCMDWNSAVRNSEC